MRIQATKVHAIHPSIWKEANILFWEVEIEDIDIFLPYDCTTISGSRSMHQAKSMSCQDVTLIQYRQHPCFCYACKGIVEEECNKIAYVPGLCLKRL
jgi:hypothetical protein